MRTFQQAMPVGIDDFKQLIQGGYFFVDKSRFIQKLLDSPVAVTLITRPRRFGKTLALSMLRYFFTLENAEENQSLFHGLDIETAGEAYRKEHGTRPVVFLTLKEVQRPTFDSMLYSRKKKYSCLLQIKRCIYRVRKTFLRKDLTYSSIIQDAF